MAAKVVHRLNPRQVQVAKDGAHANGDGLVLSIRGASASWVLRYTAPSGRRRELGLGRCIRDSIASAGKSLTKARDDAEAARRLIRDGLDPIEEGRHRRDEAAQAEQARKAEAQRDRLTVRRFVRRYHEQAVEPVRTFQHSRAWINSIERNLSAKLLDMPIAEIQPLDFLDELVEARAGDIRRVCGVPAPYAKTAAPVGGKYLRQ